MPSVDCPTTNRLIAFVVGDSVSGFENLQLHIDTCEECKKAVTRLESLIEPASLFPTFKDRTSQKLQNEVELKAAQEFLKRLPAEEHRGSSISSGSSREKRGSPRRGDFEILSTLGSGGMGVVYLAVHLPSRRQVALKMLNNPTAGDLPDIERFRREALVIDRLAHKGVPKVLYAWQEEGTCFIAMDFVDGVNLQSLLAHIRTLDRQPDNFDQVLTESKLSSRITNAVIFDHEKNNKDDIDTALDENTKTVDRATGFSIAFIRDQSYIRRVCEIVVGSALILEHAHKLGVIHRDIKPSNIMLAENEVFLIDFGLSKLVNELTLTFTKQIVGTPRYMSPEQITHSLKVDHRTDVYSLGLTLYELLTLTAAVDSDTYEGVVLGVLVKPLIPASWINHAVPDPLQGIVHKAMAKNVDDRYQRAIDFAADLDRWLQGKAVKAEPYHYRFSEHEIIARRPLVAGIAAGWLFYIGFYYGIILFPIDIGIDLKNTPRLADCAATFSQLLLPSVTGLLGGWFLLRGRKWAYWLAIATTLYVVLESAYFLWGLFKIVPSLGAMAVFFQFGELVLGRIPVIFGGCFSLFVFIFSSSIKSWLRFVNEALQEFQRSKKMHWSPDP